MCRKAPAWFARRNAGIEERAYSPDSVAALRCRAFRRRAILLEDVGDLEMSSRLHSHGNHRKHMLYLCCHGRENELEALGLDGKEALSIYLSTQVN